MAPSWGPSTLWGLFAVLCGLMLLWHFNRQLPGYADINRTLEANLQQSRSGRDGLREHQSERILKDIHRTLEAILQQSRSGTDQFEQLKAAMGQADPRTGAAAPKALRGGRRLSQASPRTDPPSQPLVESAASERNGTDLPIPRMIHQSWKTITSLPSTFEPYVASWVKFHPDWKYVFWEDTDNRALIKLVVPQFAGLYEQMNGISRADFARYALLHHFGGVYADIDFECLRPFDGLRNHSAFVGSEPLAHAVLLHHVPELPCNALMGSAPGHPFWMRVMETINRDITSRRPGDATELTGPKALYRTFQQSRLTGEDNPLLFPEEFFYPKVAINPMLQSSCIHPTAERAPHCKYLRNFPRGRFTNNTHAVHHWRLTWIHGTGYALPIDVRKVVPAHQLVRPLQDGLLRPT